MEPTPLRWQGLPAAPSRLPRQSEAQFAGDVSVLLEGELLSGVRYRTVKRMTDRLPFFITCPPGLEQVVLGEARRLKLRGADAVRGGVAFEGQLEDAWRANLWLRTGIRVLMRVARFQARNQDELYAGVRGLDWRRFLAADGTLVVSARARESKLDHTRFIEQRVKDAVVDQFREVSGQRPSVDRVAADVHIDVHIYKNRVSLSVDTSGDSLHKRGWRQEQVPASLSEVLAAGIVQLSGWDGRTPMLDPFCGAGTLLIEAGLIAARIAPGCFRERFAFEGWPGHDVAGYGALKEQARAGVALPKKLRLIGSDWESVAVEKARINAESAGGGDLLEFSVERAEEFAPRPGWNALVVTNPPYGERVGEEEALLPVYRGFGDAMRRNCSGYNLALLCGNRNLAKALALRPDGYDALNNGPIPCRLLHCTIN